jgi:glycosyltransferase involved in cell wall biosynthesis
MDKNRPLVSIIVRTKDRPKLLRAALCSIAGQTYRPIEIVLVNDGGCELDAELLGGLPDDLSLNYVRVEENRGRAHAGNLGIRNAKGNYVGFLDDDDEFYPGHVTTLVSLLEQLDYKVAYSDSLMVFKEYDPLSFEMADKDRKLLFSRDFDYDFLLFENYIPFMCLLFRKEVLDEAGGIDESLELYEDWDLLIRVAWKHPFFHVRETTALYNQWAGDMQIAQKNRDTHFVEQSYKRVLSKHRDKISERGLRHYIAQFVEARNRLMESDRCREDLERGIREKNELVYMHKRTVESLESAMKEKADRIERLEAARGRLESTIGRLEAVSREKDSRIGELDAALKTGGARIGELDAALKTGEARLWELEKDLRDKEASLQSIYSSGGWKALRAYYKLRDKLFPQGSKRRLFAKLGLAVVDDPKAFAKSLTRQNLRKFRAQYRVLDSSVVESKVKRKMSCAPGNGGYAGGSHPVQTTSPSGDSGNDLEILSPPRERNRVLVVDRWLPAYDKDSGALRMFSFLEVLRDLGYRITFLPDDLLNTEPYAGDLRRMGVEVLHGNIDIENYMKKNGGVFSHVIISRPEQAYKYIALMRAYAIHSSIIYDTVDLHWVRFERTGAVTGDKSYLKMADEYKAMELCNAMSADITFTVTEEEKAVLEREIPGVRVEVVPNIHQVARGDVPFSARRDLMFIGGYFHQPNEDAVLYFAKEILPLVREKLEGVKFFAVGSDPSEDILGLNSTDIVVTGYVRDVSPYFHNCRVFVSPLRYGAGMKGKIGQSMSYGLPVVTTSIGAEGIGLKDGENALIADMPGAFADAVVRLYTDEALWNEISRKSAEHIEANFSRKALGKKIGELLAGIVAVQVG